METNQKHQMVELFRVARPDAVHGPWPNGTNRRDEAPLRDRSASLGHDFSPGSMLPAAPERVRCGELEVDRVEKSAALAGRPMRLTRRELALLLYLAERVNRVVPRSDLLAKIWTLPNDHESNVVDVFVRRLRRKLGVHAAMLETVRGFGYCLRPALRA